MSSPCHAFYYQLRKGAPKLYWTILLFKSKTLRHFHSQQFLHPENFYLNFQLELGTVHYILSLFPTIALRKVREQIWYLRRGFTLSSQGFLDDAGQGSLDWWVCGRRSTVNTGNTCLRARQVIVQLNLKLLVEITIKKLTEFNTNK